MTKVQNPIIGRAKGSAGGMTFSKNSDQNVMRAKAFEVNNPKTAAQTTQRDYFKTLVALVSTFSPEQLRTLFPNKPKKMSRRNALTRQLSEDATISGTTKTINFAGINTLGNAKTMDFGTTTATNTNGTIAVTLDDSVKNNTELGDFMFVAAIVNDTKGDIHLPLTSAKVSVGTLSIAAPASWETSDTIHPIPLILDTTTAPTSWGTMGINERPARN